MTEWYDVTTNHALVALEKEKLIYVDIREPEEYVLERVPGSVNVPVSQFAQTNWSAYQGASVFVSCRSGKRTQINKAELMQKGLAAIYCVAGGIEQWKQAGLPTEKL